MVGALVVDVDEPERLAFPVRIAGRTLFEASAVQRHGPVPDFAHLFNGALIGAGLLAERRRGVLVHVAATCFALGTVLFCSGIFVRALTDASLGVVTPVGGVLLLVGWGVLATAPFSPAR